MKLQIVLLGIFASLVFGQDCNPDTCSNVNGCVCMTDVSPLPLEETPQFVVIAFDDSINNITYYSTYQALLSGRLNPDQNPIGATFYVPHMYTSYISINMLYVDGYEIACNSISKRPEVDYWLNSDKETLLKEFGGQNTILNIFANIPLEDIQGVRTPYMNADLTFETFVESGFKYDNSWPALVNKSIFPYTHDFPSTQDCLNGKCPNGTYPGFFEMPRNDFLGMSGIECNAMAECQTDGHTVDEIVTWLKEEFDRIYATKTPQTYSLNQRWLQTPEHFEAFSNFMDHLSSIPDVFLVAQEDVLDWMLTPQPVGNYTVPPKIRDTACEPTTCELEHPVTQEHIWMGSCVPCPAIYPWLDNPTGVTLN